jgi:RNA polymerase sigma-70 factor (ECF subfamily)
MVCEECVDELAALAGIDERASPLNSSRSNDIEDIFARYVDSVYRFLYSRVGNREDAEDLTSETFLAAARHLDTRRSEASIARWLFTVARTRLADHWRRHYRKGAAIPFDELHMEIMPHDLDPVPSEETDQLVTEILHALPERYRRVLELRFLRGYSVNETAQELAMTPENAKVLQHRALARADKLVLADQILGSGLSTLMENKP